MYVQLAPNRKEIKPVNSYKMKIDPCDRRQKNSRRIGNLQSNQPPRLSEHMGWAPLIHYSRNCQFLHDSLTVDPDRARLHLTTKNEWERKENHRGSNHPYQPPPQKPKEKQTRAPRNGGNHSHLSTAMMEMNPVMISPKDRKRWKDMKVNPC